MSQSAFQPPYPTTAWQQLGSINNWSRAREFHDLIDTDFDKAVAHYTLGREFIFRARSFVPIAAAWLVFLIGWGFALVPEFPREWDLMATVIVLMTAKRFFTAAAAAIADDLCAGQKHGLATLGRALRGWLFMLPFWFLPPFVVGMMLWWVVPIPYFVSIFGHNIYAGTPMIGRFYHGVLPALTGSRLYRERGLLAPLGDLVARHRTVTFDVAGDSTVRLFVFYILSVAVACVVLFLWGDDPRSGTAFFLVFAVFSTLDLFVHAVCAVQMVRTYNAVCSGELAPEPLLRQCAPETRWLYGLWVFAPIGVVLLVFLLFSQ